MTDAIVPYVIMFCGGAVASLLDIHTKEGFAIIDRHRISCTAFILLMGFVGAFFFFAIWTLELFSPRVTPLIGSLIVLLGYRLLIKSNLINVKVGASSKGIGFGWMYDGLLYLFIDYLKSRESISLQGEYRQLPMNDLVSMAQHYATTPEERQRVEEITKMQDEEFKRRWLSQLCAEREQKQ